MFILHLPLAVFSFSVKLSTYSFASASKARIVLYIHIFFMEKTQTRISRLPFAVNAILNLSVVLNPLENNMKYTVVEFDVNTSYDSS